MIQFGPYCDRQYRNMSAESMRSEPRISFPATFAGDECEMVAHEAQSCLWWAGLDLRQKLMCPRIEVFSVDHIVFDAICAGDFLSCRFESVVEVWQLHGLDSQHGLMQLGH